MSLSQMEKALAMLIRLPETNRGGDLEEFLGEWDLTEREKRQLTVLSGDAQVTKYGRGMQDVRGGSVKKHLPVSSLFLEKEFFDFILRSKFDPVATQYRAYTFALRFLDFVFSDQEARHLMEKYAPPFIYDLFAVERVRVQFRVGELPSRGPLPLNSLLAHDRFDILRLNYDVLPLIAKFARQGPTEQEEPKAPQPKPTVVIALPKNRIPDCRLFEINEELAQFIEGQVDGSPSVKELPESYPDLVRLGLCKAVQ